MRNRYYPLKPKTSLLLVALLAWLAIGFNAPVRAAGGIYQVVRHNLPKTVQPGQQVMGQVILKVVEPGTPDFTRPFASLHSSVDPKRDFDLPGDKMSPWQFPAHQKPGDTLCAGFSLDVPVDFPAGPARIGLIMTRDDGRKGWQYASFVDAAGKALGTTFVWAGEVVTSRAGDGDTARTLPLVVGRMKAPALDGRIDPEEWKAAGHIAQFRENSGHALKAQSQAWVGHDDKNLYVAVVCREPLMAKAKQNPMGRGRDPGVWNNESVEIFLNPQADQASFLQFDLDILNQRYDALGSDCYGYNPKWQSAVAKSDNSWSVEVVLPFSSLGVTVPPPGQLWYGNLCRERYAEPELSAWTPAFGSFDAPGRFGMWVFDSLQAYLQQKASPLKATELAGVKELDGRVREWSAAMTVWRDRLAKLKDATTAMEYPKLASDLDRLTGDYKRLQMEKMRLAGGSAFVVTQSWPFEKFNGDLSPQDKPAGEVRVTALRDEWVDLAWNVKNFIDKPVTLRCFVVNGAYNPYSSEDHLRLGLPGVEMLWQQVFPVAAGDGRPVYDAVTPIAAGLVQVPPGAACQVWLSMRNAGKGQSPLSGRVVFAPVDGTEAKPVVLPLTLTTLPMSLTAQPKLHGFTWDFFTKPIIDNPDWYRAHLKDLRAHGIDILEISGLRDLPRVRANSDGTLAEKMDFTKLDYLLSMSRDLFPQYYLSLDIWEKNSLRMDLFGLPIHSAGYEKAFRTWFRQVLDHLKAQGIGYDRFVVNPYDESSGAECQRLARWIKAVDPKVRVAIDTSNTDPQDLRRMDALTDVWIPHYKTFFSEDVKPFHDYVRSTGKPHWCYFYSEGGNEKNQDPASYYLGKFWWAFANHVGAVTYWTYGYYGDPWYRTAWKSCYDTALVYPTDGGVIPSRRWQAWRQGWQDHCLLSLAKDRFAAKQDRVSLTKLDALVKDVVAVPGDPVRRENARAWVKTKLSER